MTISTKNFQVPLIRFPIPEAARPIVRSFLGRDFCCLIDMMNVKNPNIPYPTSNTLSAKFADKLNFTLPIAAFLLKIISLFIPKVFLADRRTKLSIGWFSAISAYASMTPSGSVVAGYATELYTRLAPICFAERHIKFLSAIFTIEGNSVFFHNSIIPQLPINFAIAERRIHDAQQQMPLPLEVNA